MNGFANVTSPTVAAPDPTKHVKYNLGMVLGVDDFDQEFAYLSGRDQWLARDLIGYGTICGLQVTTDVDARGPRVTVSPGAALNPRGQLIRVTPAQCAYLNNWLSEHKDDLMRRIGSPVGSSVALYVTLCYRDCPVDQVPIAGEPCRTESEATVASRLSDDFKLELRFDPPDQTEENALRDFVAWLRQIQITEGATTVSLEDFLNAIRAAGEPSSPVSPPDFMYGSPPSGIQINTADACEYLRAAFRVWVTELRARWRKNNCDAPDEGCVLLAELDVPLTSGWQVDDTRSVAIIEEHRPYLIHLRMLQEWLLCARRESAASGAGAGTPSNSVVSEMAPGQASDAGMAITYSRGDHTHGTPLSPMLAGDVTGPVGSNTLSKIQGKMVDALSPTDQQVLTFVQAQNKWTPASVPVPTLAGDVAGAISNNTVVKVQNVPVVAPNLAADNGKVLTLVGNQWQASSTVGSLTISGDASVGGTLGIGTTAPDRSLTISNSAGANYMNVKDGTREILMGVDGTGGIVSVMTNHDLVLRAGTNSEKMRITAAGNVGVGTMTPGLKLDVNGRIRLRQAGDPSAGIWLFQTTPNADRAFVGMANDNAVGFWGPGAGWGLWMDTTTGNVSIKGSISAGGGKGGYVMDQFVNNVGDTLEQGDVVVISGDQPSHHYGSDNNIPVPEVDLARRAYDTRVCGIVGEVYGELRYEMGEETNPKAKVTKPKKGKGGKPSGELQPRAFTGEELAQRDRAKIESGQIGWMVTLGAFAHCKVDADIAPIKVGDLLTASPTKGHAQKVQDMTRATGAILAKALGSLSKGKGKIPVLVMLQ